MNPLLEQFESLLQKEQKEDAVKLALNLLSSQQMDPVTLYTDILTPCLNNITCALADKRLCVWKEHVRSATVRTIIECAYPYILEQRDLNKTPIKGKAVVLCPPEEYHDIGARMVADFFTLSGFDTIFVGSNTPYQDFYDAADLIKPDIIAISVSNHYNLVITKKIISELRNRFNKNCQIIVGGNAFKNNPANIKSVGADGYAQTYSDIQNITLKEAE